MSDRNRGGVVAQPGRVLVRVVGLVAVLVLGAACSGADQIGQQTDDPPSTDTGAPSEMIPDVPVTEPAAPGDTASPDDSAPEAPPVEESSPDDSPPSTSPPEDGPDSTDPPADDDPAGGDDPGATGPENDDVDPALVALALAGFVVLLGIAAWWMLRRADADDEIGHPDQHDWPDGQMSM
jgi:hypothetical protein